ncbi:hypothetical protein IBA8401_01370 [Pseudomonas syringae]|uniref:hypothetical protein n=1 Tax=Pseudomonas syringae group TaxID=136849 RepID=UPI0022A6727F|nr:hypothetical protein [Pseudomonas syringae group genomosp. 3]MCZ0947938.1 hypothetical protein [Pseudomonas syringae pv. tomato]
MRKSYVIKYKLHGVEHEEPLSYGPADSIPISEFTAYSTLILKHFGLDKGEPARMDVYEQAEKAGITGVEIVEAA